jgi:hypothetical protein
MARVHKIAIFFFPEKAKRSEHKQKVGSDGADCMVKPCRDNDCSVTTKNKCVENIICLIIYLSGQYPFPPPPPSHLPAPLKLHSINMYEQLSQDRPKGKVEHSTGREHAGMVARGHESHEKLCSLDSNKRPRPASLTLKHRRTQC